MGQQNDKENKSRRNFFTNIFSGKIPEEEKVKMLTPDGKLVEIDKRLLDAARQNKKASNHDILSWMQNPSKDEGNSIT